MLAQLIAAMFRNNSQHVALEFKSQEEALHEPRALMKTPRNLGATFEGSVLLVSDPNEHTIAIVLMIS
jgi:hypothetical protein